MIVVVVVVVLGCLLAQSLRSRVAAAVFRVDFGCFGVLWFLPRAVASESCGFVVVALSVW